MSSAKQKSASPVVEITSSAALRWLIENVWLLAMPLCIGLFFLLAYAMNTMDVSVLKFPRVIQLALAVALTWGLSALPYRIWPTAFSRAQSELELLYEAKQWRTLAKRWLRKAPVQATKQPVERALQQLKHALAHKQGIRHACAELERLLPRAYGQKTTGTAKEYISSFGTALLVALLVRGFLIGNYQIPSGSMIPTLQVGDHLFVNEFVFGISVPFFHWKITPALRAPKRGEIIVFVDPKQTGKDLIKRVLAGPGDKVLIQGDDVFVNDQKLRQEPLPQEYAFVDKEESTGTWRPDVGDLFRETNGTHTYTTMRTKNAAHPPQQPVPIIVPEDCVYVMGDNRHNSSDSRYWGFVPYKNIKGKAIMIWYSEGVRFPDPQQPEHHQPSVRFDRPFHFVH